MTFPETTAHFQMLNNAQSFLRSRLWTPLCNNDALSPKKILLNFQRLQETSSISPPI
jgi:hypothetical protein